MNYLYGFTSASFVYWSLSHFFPAPNTVLGASIYDDNDIIFGLDEGRRDCDITETNVEHKMSPLDLLSYKR